ncbi:MAG: hypothetical protein JJU28_01630 [Cyclobacteriaceae bacterium]|nr:hypothetical protein [Cyclobacteriaceae bacterium]
MKKLILVSGPQGCGKSQYITKHFTDRSRYYVMDLPEVSMNIFGNLGALEDEQQVITIYNQVSEEATMAFLDDNLQIVAEICTLQPYDDELMALIEQARSAGIRVDHHALKPVHIGADDKKGYSSGLLREDMLMLLGDLIENFDFNSDFELLARVTHEEVEACIYLVEWEGRERFFYTTEPDALYEFEPKYFFEQEPGVNYIKFFSCFEDAYSHLLSEQEVFFMIPVYIHPEYKGYFAKAYAAIQAHPEIHSAWKAFFN